MGKIEDIARDLVGAWDEWARAVRIAWHSPRPPKDCCISIDGQILIACPRGRVGVDIRMMRRGGPGVWTFELDAEMETYAARRLNAIRRWLPGAAETSLRYAQRRAAARHSVLEWLEDCGVELELAGVRRGPTSRHTAAHALASDTIQRLSVLAPLLKRHRYRYRVPRWWKVVAVAHENVFGQSYPVCWDVYRVGSDDSILLSRPHGDSSLLESAREDLIADVAMLMLRARKWLSRTNLALESAERRG